MPLLPLLSQETYAPVDKQILSLVEEQSPCCANSTVGSTGHVRAGYLELSAAISSLPNQSALRDIEIYADTLEALGPVTIDKKIDSLIIFARQISIDSKAIINIGGDLLIRIYCSGTSLPLQLTISGPSGKKDIDVTADYNVQGIDIDINFKKLTADVSPLKSSPKESFNVPDLVDRILDNGQLAAIGSDKMNDNLPELCRYQLLLAAAWRQSAPAHAYDIGTYIAKITQKVPKAFDLYSRALSFASSQAANSGDQLAPQIPLLALNSSKAVLKARLQAAIAFDDAFRDFTGQQANATNTKLFATVALQASQDADARYSYLSDLAKVRFDAAKKSLNTAQATFLDLQKDIPAKQQAFQDGIKKWKTQKIAEVVVKGLVAVGMIAGSIALACVFPPGGAGALAGAVELPEIAGEIEEGISAVSDMAYAIELIKKIYDKLAPGLEKIGQLVETIQKVVELVGKIKHVDDTDDGAISKLQMPASEGDDTINLNADWDTFNTEMATMYEPIKEEGIGGASEYFLLVAKMVIRGKAVLAAQQAVTSTADAYITVLTQKLDSERQTARLQAAISQMQGNPAALRLIKLSLFDRLLSMRSWITLDIKQYMDAYSWYALDSTQFITLDPLKEIGAFAADAAMLQAYSAQAGAQMRRQSRVFHLSSSVQGGEHAASSRRPGLLALSNSFLEDLSKDHKATFNISPTHIAFEQVGRVRLESFHIFLESAEAIPYVSIKVVLGEEMLDLKPEPMPADDPTQLEPNAGRILHFTTASTTLGFAYEEEGGHSNRRKEIVLEGVISDLAVKPSPFRPWTLIVDEGVDVSGVTGVRLEMTCEVTVLEQAVKIGKKKDQRNDSVTGNGTNGST